MHSYSLILELYSEEIPAKMQKKAELAFQEI
ncbi:glycyl-tRNA synthetase beta chain domain protein, partial [Orientia tsutsugamushi str. UT76]